MNTFPEPACVASDDGHPCPRVAVMQRPVALCHAHRIEIALATVPALLLDQLAGAQQETSTPAPRSDLVATARAAVVADLLHGVHGSVVYFLANGGRVKIGYTTNLRSRLASLALRNDSVLLALHGGPDLERALHSHFAAYRDGTTEWFELAPEVFRFIAMPHPATAAAEGRTATEDSLTAEAHTDFASDLTNSQVPSIRTLRGRYGIGQPRATRIQTELKAALA